MNIRQLLKLKEENDLMLVEWNKNDKKLRDECHHPAEYIDTKSEYYTDTLGSNGRTEYSYCCAICGIYFTERPEQLKSGAV